MLLDFTINLKGVNKFEECKIIGIESNSLCIRFLKRKIRTSKLCLKSVNKKGLLTEIAIEKILEKSIKVIKVSQISFKFYVTHVTQLFLISIS